MKVFKCNWLISLVASVGLSCSIATPGWPQALLPYTPTLNSEKLKEQGEALFQDTIQLAQFQQFQLAFSYAKLVTQLIPNDYRPWFILGTISVQQEELEEGIVALRRALKLAPKEGQAGILFTLGEAYFSLGDYTAAVEELAAGLELEPNAPEALFNLGNSYFRLKEHQLAIANYQEAYSQSKKEFWPAINNVGLVKYEQGDVAGAIADWQATLTIAPEAAEPQLAIAVALYTRGEKDRGLALGSHALAIDSSYGELEFLKKNLWGDRLLRDTEIFLRTPEIQAVLGSIQKHTP